MHGKLASSLSVLAISLIACSGAVAPSPPNEAPDFDASWMAPGAKAASQLLYVSDLKTFDVYVYSFPSLKLTGKLHGFEDPEGECIDTAGNVWIVDTQGKTIVEFSHGGANPIAKLADPAGNPAGCAVDALSGDLAVTNLYGNSGPGSVIVFRNARGTPHIYSNSQFHSYYYAGYDSKGDLYVSGTTLKGTYLLGALPHDGTSLSLVKISGGSLYVPGTVAWRGSTLVLGDQRCKNRQGSCFYESSVTDKTAHITHVIPLSGSCDVAQAWVGSTQVVGANDAAYCTPRRSTVDIWRYPAGGKPSSSVTGPGIPVGAAVSTH
jgi:hypothetical protein